MESSSSEDSTDDLKEPLLLDRHRMYEDTRLVAKAAKQRWPINQKKRNTLVNRLTGIVEKTSVSTMTKHGEVVEVELPADINAIQAAKVLVEMEAQNQKDDHAAEGIGGNNVQINIGTDALEMKAAQYGLTESRLKRLVERRVIEEEQADNGGTDP